MRIIGNIEHPTLKITVFQMDNRLSVKLENGLYEQTYKFRAGEGIQTLEDVNSLLDPFFLGQASALFTHMHQVRNKRLSELQAPEEDAFDEII